VIWTGCSMGDGWLFSGRRRCWAPSCAAFTYGHVRQLEWSAPTGCIFRTAHDPGPRARREADRLPGCSRRNVYHTCKRIDHRDTAAMRLASPSRRPLDLVSEVNGQRTGVRRARAQQEVRRWPLVEQARAGAQDRGHKVQAELVNRAGREVLAGHVRAAVDQHVV